MLAEPTVQAEGGKPTVALPAFRNSIALKIVKTQ